MWKHNENPTGRTRHAMLAALGVAAVALLSLSPSAAADRHLSLEFEAYVGGINALTVGVDAYGRPADA